MRRTRLVLAQTNPVLGDLHRNLDAHLSAIDDARAREARFVAFPELSLTGYFLKDQTSELALRRDAQELRRIAAASRGMAIGCGFVERSRDERLYNAYAIFEDGNLVGVHRKVHLVTYGMFEESRDFAAGESYETFDLGLSQLRAGVLTCEDAWHLGGTYLHFTAGADVLLVPSAGPARGVRYAGDGARADEPGFESVRTWDTLLAALAMFTQTYVCYVNRVGFEDGIGFGGASQIVAPNGQRVAVLEGLDAGTLSFELDPGALRRARVRTPLLRDERPELLRAALERRAAPADPGVGRP